MVKIAKYLFACVILVASRQTIAAILVPDCDYVLCRNSKAQQGDTGYYASGSAISSQFVLPDGSVVTKSKESMSSSGGAVKQTFHALKKEADHFVQGGELGDALKRIPLTQFPKVPSDIAFPDPLNQLPLAPEFHTGGVQSSYQSQSSSSVHQTGSQQYQPVAPVITSYRKEHELEKQVVSSHGSSGYPSGNVITEYNANQQQSGGNTGAVFEHSVRFPSEASLNQNKDSTYYGYGQQYSNVQAPIVAGSQSSYEKYESSSQKKSAEVQPNIFTNLKPNTFSTNVVELTANKHTGQDGITTVVRLPTVNVPPQTREDHYESSVNVQKENKYNNAVPIVVKLPAHSKYEYEDQIKTEEYGTGVKPVVAPLNSVQYGKNQASHSQTLYVGTSGTSAAGLPSSHISPLTVHVVAPAAGSQTYQKQESASSQISSGHQVPVISVPSSYYRGDQYQKFDGTVYSHSAPTSKSESYQKQESASSHVSSSQQVPIVPIPASFSGSQYQTSGSVYTQEGSHIPVVNEQTSSHDKKASSDSQSYGFQSPILVHGVPQNVQIDQQYGGTYKAGEASDGLSVPILVHGVPQIPNQSFSSSSSSGSSSSYYSSSKTGGSVAFPAVYDTSNKVQGASSSIYDKLTQNSDAESLCSGCIGGVSSSNIPVKNSYGISTSFKSSSRTINGQKTENREASVAVNDNGKIDSYHVKS